MKAMTACTKQMFRQVAGDMMLTLSCFVPLMVGLLIRFLVPFAESRLAAPGASVLAPYYPLFDLFLACIGPIMLCFATTMILLEEIDDKVARSYSVSPLGKGGYLLVRLGIPAILAFLANILVLFVFSLSGMDAVRLLVVAALGSVQAVIISMMIIVFSKNKLEGMAVTKMAAITLLGLPAPYFLRGWVGYLPGFLPAYWMGRMSQTTSPLPVFMAALVSAVWIVFLSKGFLKKLAT